MKVSAGLAWLSVVSNQEGLSEEVRALLVAEAEYCWEHSCMVLCGGEKPHRSPAQGQSCSESHVGEQGLNIQPTWQRNLACAGLLHLHPTFKCSHLRTVFLSPNRLNVLFSFQPAGDFFGLTFLFVCNAYLASPSCLCVHFSFPGLVSGMRRRRRKWRRKRNSQSRSPIQRKRERTMPPLGARTGTEGWTLSGTTTAWGSFLMDSLQLPVGSLFPSSLAPTGKPLLTLYTEPQND